MSYCRWSTDDFACDIYAYESTSGYFSINVATHRIVGDVPKLPLIKRGATTEEVTAWNAAYAAQMKFLDSAERAPIGGPFDGQEFREFSLGAMLDRLMALRSVGYNFPDSVIEKIKAEMEDEMLGEGDD